MINDVNIVERNFHVLKGNKVFFLPQMTFFFSRFKHWKKATFSLSVIKKVCVLMTHSRSACEWKTFKRNWRKPLPLFFPVPANSKRSWPSRWFWHDLVNERRFERNASFKVFSFRLAVECCLMCAAEAFFCYEILKCKASEAGLGIALVFHWDRLKIDYEIWHLLKILQWLSSPIPASLFVKLSRIFILWLKSHKLNHANHLLQSWRFYLEAFEDLRLIKIIEKKQTKNGHRY